MKRLVKMCLLVSLLTGCGVAQQMQLNSASERAMTEIARKCSFYQHLSVSEAKAWNEVIDRSNAQCAHGAKGQIPRDTIIAVGSCYKQLLDDKVRPMSYSPSAFDRMKDKADSVRTQYANGTISWEDYQAEVFKITADYVESGKKGSYFNVASCHNEIVNREIMPVYQYKHLLTQYMTDVLTFARQADKQKMASEDFQVGTQKLWAEFIAKEQGAITQTQTQQTAAWQNTIQNLQKLDTAKQSQAGKRICMSHPDTGAYLECFHVMADGRCAHYGPPCL